MTYVLIDPPSAEPLTLVQVKAHLRIEHDDEDDLLAALAMTVRQHLERETGLCLLVQRWRFYLDLWPKGGVIEMARGPVQTIDCVTVYDADGNASQISLQDHLLDGASRPARLWLRDPPAPGRAVNGIEIDFTAGFGEAGADLPSPLIRAMLIHVGFMYGFRGVVSPEQQPAGIPDGYERLIGGFRLRRL